MFLKFMKYQQNDSDVISNNKMIIMS
jgi:hypothetical protein